MGSSSFKSAPEKVSPVSKSAKDDDKDGGPKKTSLGDMRAKLNKAADEGRNQSRMKMLREGIKENVEKRRSSIEAAIKKSEVVRKKAREISKEITIGRKKKKKNPWKKKKKKKKKKK